MRKEGKIIRIKHKFNFGTCNCNRCFVGAQVRLETKRFDIKFHDDPIEAQAIYDGMEDDYVNEYGDDVLK